MATRSTMATLIARCRTLINDPASGGVFSDQDIQDTLDQRRMDVRYEELTPTQTIAPGGTTSWFDFYADLDQWEDGYTLVNSNYTVLTDTGSEPLLGHFVLSASQWPPVMIVGKTYDVYGSCAELLEEWLAKLKLTAINFMDQGQSLSVNQQIANMEASIAKYRAKSRPIATLQVRSDMRVGSRFGDRW